MLLFLGPVFIFLFFLPLLLCRLLATSSSQYRISSPLNKENPEKRPSVPPMLEIMSIVVMVAVFVICSCLRKKGVIVGIFFLFFFFEVYFQIFKRGVYAV